MRLDFDKTYLTKIFEADFFKGSDPDDIKNRKEEVAIVHKAALEKMIEDFGPSFAMVKRLIPDVEEAEADYRQTARMTCGNYGKSTYYGFPNKISFNIKIYDYNIPNDISAKLDTYRLWDTFGERIKAERADILEDFMGDLQNKYSFIKVWFVEGRMDGWLVLRLDSIGYYVDDIDTMVAAVQDTNTQKGLENFVEYYTKSDLDDVVVDWKGYIDAIDQRIIDIDKIENAVKTGKNAVAMMYDKEWFDEFFSEYENQTKECRIKEGIFKNVSEDFFKGPSADDVDKRKEERRKNSVQDDDISALEETILDLARDEADEIYSSLEKQYDYLMSDEGVAESIEANELEFDVGEDGKLVEFSGDEAVKQVSFDDLDDEDKETAINARRENPEWLEYSWWDGDIGYTWTDSVGKKHKVKGFHNEELEKKGFENAEIYLSGFNSQGDGACFTCRLDVPKIVDHYKIEVSKAVKRDIDLFNGSITTSGNYYHSNTMSLDLEYEGNYD